MERYLKDEPGTAASCAALRKTESFEMLTHLALALEHPVTSGGANSPMWPWTATVVKQEPSSESSVTTDPEEDEELDDDTTEESDDQLLRAQKHDIALR